MIHPSIRSLLVLILAVLMLIAGRLCERALLGDITATILAFLSLWVTDDKKVKKGE